MKAYAASMRSTGCWERLKHRSSGGVARRETPVRDYRWQGRPKHCERLALGARHGEDAHAQHFQEDGNQDPPRAAAAILEELATQKRRGISSPLASFLGFYPQGSVPSVVSGLDAHGSLSTTVLVLTTSQSSKKINSIWGEVYSFFSMAVIPPLRDACRSCVKFDFAYA